MNNKRSKLNLVTDAGQAPKKGRLVNTRSRSTNQQVAAELKQTGVAKSVGTQIFSSEEQALEALVAQVVSRCEDDPDERAEMKEFLNSFLAMDPDLVSEILAGTTIRRS
ncbi:MAG: hypothetical protein ACK5GN_01775 [Pseudomonadota bacterium]|jgi:hypothetical protein